MKVKNDITEMQKTCV